MSSEPRSWITCGRCGKPNDRPVYNYCRRCHADYTRAWRRARARGETPPVPAARCTCCGRVGHNYRTCPERDRPATEYTDDGSANITCSECGARGHNRRACEASDNFTRCSRGCGALLWPEDVADHACRDVRRELIERRQAA